MQAQDKEMKRIILKKIKVVRGSQSLTKKAKRETVRQLKAQLPKKPKPEILEYVRELNGNDPFKAFSWCIFDPPEKAKVLYITLRYGLLVSLSYETPNQADNDRIIIQSEKPIVLQLPKSPSEDVLFPTKHTSFTLKQLIRMVHGCYQVLQSKGVCTLPPTAQLRRVFKNGRAEIYW